MSITPEEFDALNLDPEAQRTPYHFNHHLRPQVISQYTH